MKKKIIIGVTIIMLVGGSILYYFRRKKVTTLKTLRAELLSDAEIKTALNKPRKNWSAGVDSNLVSSLTGIDGATSEYPFPFIESASNGTNRELYKKYIRDYIVQTYGKFVEKSSAYVKVPKWVIYGFMASHIDPNSTAFKKMLETSGVMKLTAINAKSAVINGKKLNNIDEPFLRSSMIKLFGEETALRLIDNFSKTDSTSTIELSKFGNKVAKDPQLNIYLGAVRIANLYYSVNEESSVLKTFVWYNYNKFKIAKKKYEDSSLFKYLKSINAKEYEFADYQVKSNFDIDLKDGDLEQNVKTNLTKDVNSIWSNAIKRLVIEHSCTAQKLCQIIKEDNPDLYKVVVNAFGSGGAFDLIINDLGIKD
jgi:hypothetical protein